VFHQALTRVVAELRSGLCILWIGVREQPRERRIVVQLGVVKLIVNELVELREQRLEQLAFHRRELNQHAGDLGDDLHDCALTTAPSRLHAQLLARSTVAHSPYSCIASVCRSISSRGPLATIARPFWCTCNMSRSASGFG
jgi:hypothetical protein